MRSLISIIITLFASSAIANVKVKSVYSNSLGELSADSLTLNELTELDMLLNSTSAKNIFDIYDDLEVITLEDENGNESKITPLLMLAGDDAGG